MTSLRMSPLLFVVAIFGVSFAQDCIFTDSITNQYKLDLSSLSGKEIDFYSDGGYNYSYSICVNNMWCVPKYQTPTNAMISQWRIFFDECYWLAKWDDGATQPTYNTTTETWSFKYQGMPCESAFLPARNTTVNWHCNSSVDYEISILQTTTCNYIITIESRYACVAEPSNYCQWHVPYHTLDLTVLSDITIIGKDAKDSEMIFAYTPCRNGTMCVNLDVMVKMDNVTTSTGCDMYLAIWEDDLNGGMPSYDEQKGIWRFEYQNGGLCDGLDSSLFIYWYCDESVVDPLYEVVYAQKVQPCLYDISIASSLACSVSKR